MFDNKNQNDNQNRPTPPSMNESSDQGQEKEETSQESSKDVYTMPKKFRSTGKGSGSSKKKKIITIVVAIVVFAGLAVGAAYLFQTLSNPEDNKNVVVNKVNDNLNANENLNLNENTNINQNLNNNTNTNTNTGNANVNLNQNENQNINSNMNLNTNTTANTNTNTSLSLTPLPSTSDTDEDGLTDVEESLWGTGVNTPDTDGDGYIDGKKELSSGDVSGELYLGYDPTVKDKRLQASSLVETYTNNSYNWSMLYPSKWTATQMSATTGEKNIMFSPNISTVEYIQVTVEENTSRLSAKNWYLSLNPNISTGQLEEIVINGLSGILTPDKTAVYLGKEDKIYLINYNVGNLSEVNYQTTFEMMYQSFKLISSSTSSNQNTNTNSNQNQNINAS